MTQLDRHSREKCIMLPPARHRTRPEQSAFGDEGSVRACNGSGGKWRISTMTNFKYGVISAAGLALLLCVTSVSAQQSPPVRVRGEIQKVEGDTLTVKSREGATVTVKLKDNAAVTGVDKAMLSDIKQNSFVGITAMPQPDGTRSEER